MSSGISCPSSPHPHGEQLREGNALVFAEPLRWGGWYGPVCPPSTGSWPRTRPFSTVSFVNSLELGGEPGLPPRVRVGAASLGQGPWKTAAWAGVVSGVEQRERECRALEGAANVGWALLPALGVGGSRQQVLQESAGFWGPGSYALTLLSLLWG